MHTLIISDLSSDPVSSIFLIACAALSDTTFHTLLWAVVSCNRRDLGVAASTIDLKWHCYFSWPNWVFKNYGISTETDITSWDSGPNSQLVILVYLSCLLQSSSQWQWILFWFFFSLGISLGRERNVDISQIAPYSLMPLGLKNCWSKTTGCAETKCGGFWVSVVLHF